jgi:hypothetical protein
MSFNDETTNQQQEDLSCSFPPSIMMSPCGGGQATDACFDMMADSEIMSMLDLDLDRMFNEAIQNASSLEHSFSSFGAATATTTPYPHSQGNSWSISTPMIDAASKAAVPVTPNTLDNSYNCHQQNGTRFASIPNPLTTFSPASNTTTQLILPRSTLPQEQSSPQKKTVIEIAPRETHNVSPSPSEERQHQQQLSVAVITAASTTTTDSDTTENSQRKRKRVSTTTTAAAASGAKKQQKRALSSYDIPLPPLSEEDDNEEARKERNRLHAKRSRQRRKTLTNDLQESLTMLRQENQKLRQLIVAKMQSKKAQQVIIQERMKPTEHFLAQLRDEPRNRIVNAKTLRFLQGLSKNLPKKEDMMLDQEDEEDFEEEDQPINVHDFNNNKEHDDFLTGLDPFIVMG